MSFRIVHLTWIVNIEGNSKLKLLGSKSDFYNSCTYLDQYIEPRPHIIKPKQLHNKLKHDFNTTDNMQTQQSG